MSRHFRVWDPNGESEFHASVVKAWSADEAAEEYAEHDVDGLTAGIYTGGHEVAVIDPLEPERTRVFVVRVDYEPTFHAEEKRR